MFELVSAHKTGRKTKFLPKFAVKSWEDKILGALVRCRRQRLKDHAKLENKALALFFFAFSPAIEGEAVAKYVDLLTVKNRCRRSAPAHA